MVASFNLKDFNNFYKSIELAAITTAVVNTIRN